MTTTSRPLRALGVILGSWTAARVVALWPMAGTATDMPPSNVAPVARAQPVVAMRLDDDVPLFAARPLSERGRKALKRFHGMAMAEDSTAATVVTLPEAVDAQPVAAVALTRGERGAPQAPGLPIVRSANRFSGSAWALMRGNGSPSLANGGQLGGSQIGMRLFYVPGPDALAVTARISTPISQRGGREAAIGVALRGRNIGLIAEQRISLDKSGRDAPAVFAYGGVSDVKILGGLTLDGYAQGGVVSVKSPAAFIDGALRIERNVLTAKDASLSVGAGMWGGAQPGVARLDIGPQLVARVRVADMTLRASAEWRQRIAGNAAPSSGPSVTVGLDF